MKQAITVYNKALPEFKREASAILKEHFPDNFKDARALMNRFLEKEDRALRRWYNMLLLGWLSAADFIRLFSGLKNIFSLKELKKNGISPEKIKEVTQLIIKLYRAMIICRSGILEPEVTETKIRSLTKTSQS
jgi:hypothetical protein